MIRHGIWRALALSLLLIAAPLPFGSVAPLFSTLLLIGSLVALALAILHSRGERLDPERVPSGLRRAAIALAAVALLGGIQSLAWPRGVVRAISPRVADLALQAADLAGSEAPGRIALSLAPGSSRSAAMDWLMAASALFAAAWIGSSRRVRRVLFGALLVSAIAQIAIGVELWLSRSTSLWGIEVPNTLNRIRGSFVNPNHLALFLEIVLTATFAWLWFVTRRSWSSDERAERRLARVAPAALAFLLLFAGVVLTGSRAGILATLAALAVQGVLTGASRQRYRLAGLVAAGAGILFILLFRVEGSFGRIAETAIHGTGGISENTRLQAALATLDLWRVSPVTGVGLGAFRAAFPLVQPESLAGLWRHAHSDWVELLATAGVIGMGLLLFGLWNYVRRLRVVLADGESSEERAAGVAAAGALVVVGLHSFADFGLTMPANALALAVVLGAAAAARTRTAAANG